MARDIRSKSGSALLDFILADIQELKRVLMDPRSHQVFMGAMDASGWLNEQLEAWLGEKNAADTLTKSVPDNITSEMGLALLDVADVVRPYPEVVAFLEDVEGEGFLDELRSWRGGPEARTPSAAFLDGYGMRCVGEIDITRPRWSERPTTLVPMILGNIRNFEPGAGGGASSRGPGGAGEGAGAAGAPAGPAGRGAKAEEAKRMIDRVRTFMGYREYPKYFIVGRFFAYKRALLEEAERLVRPVCSASGKTASSSRSRSSRTSCARSRWMIQLIARRKEAFRSYEALTPPRVLTSEGEVVTGAYRRDDAPAGALIGLPVSAGTIEGRARVILDVADAELEPGDILVTAFTDPSWSPLFVAISGSGDGGRGPDDPRRGDRPGVRPAGRRGRGARHPADPGRAADPRARN